MQHLVKNLSDAMSLNLKVVHEVSLEGRSRILSSPNIKKYQKLSIDDLKAVLNSVDSSSNPGLNYVQSSREKMNRGRGEWGGGGGGRGAAGARGGASLGFDLAVGDREALSMYGHKQ